MGRVGLCTVESYIGGEFFEPNYLDTRDPVLARCFPHLAAPVGGVGFTRIAPGLDRLAHPGLRGGRGERRCRCSACSRSAPTAPGTRTGWRPSAASPT